MVVGNVPLHTNNESEVNATQNNILYFVIIENFGGARQLTISLTCLIANSSLLHHLSRRGIPRPVWPVVRIPCY